MLSLIIFAIALLPRYYTAKNMDMTWDEATYTFCGVTALSNLVHRRFSSKDWEFEFHPPLGMVFIGLSYGLYIFLDSLVGKEQISEESLRSKGIGSFRGQKALLAIRMPSIIFGSSIAVLVFLLTFAIFNDYEIAAVAGLFCALAPNLVAWTSLALLESPLTFFYVGSIWTAMLAMADKSLLFLTVSGLLFGLVLSTKLSGAMAAPVFLIWFAFGGPLRPILWVTAVVIAYYLAYPALWRNPVGYFFRNLKAQRSLFTNTKKERITFHIENFLATTPIPLSVGAIVGLFSIQYLSPQPLFLVFLGAFLPLITLSLPKIPRYGVNTYFYILPMVAIVATLGITKAGSGLGIFSHLLVVGAVLSVGYSLVRTFPYLVGYQNLVSDRVRGTNAYLGYMGEGLSKAIQYVDSNAHHDAVVWIYAPKSTSLYHSTRASLRAAFAREPLFVARVRAGFEVPVDQKIYDLRTGDVSFYYPYYYDLDANGINKSLKDTNVEFVVLYKAALTEISQSSVSRGNNAFCEFIHNECAPVYSVSLKGIEVCWVYKVDAHFLDKIKDLEQQN